MDVDDLIRDKDGVVICVRDEGDGRSRIIIDDVTNLSETGQGDWKHHLFVTWKEYKTEELAEISLSENELAEFGHFVLARLIAIKNTRNRK